MDREKAELLRLVLSRRNNGIGCDESVVLCVAGSRRVQHMTNKGLTGYFRDPTVGLVG